jgi:hypothetical protein
MTSYKKMMAMLLQCQSDNGMWRQLRIILMHGRKALHRDVCL